jgi:hypothetical protein
LKADRYGAGTIYRFSFLERTLVNVGRSGSNCRAAARACGRNWRPA